MAAARTPLECTEETNNKDAAQEQTPLECTEKGRTRLCISLAFLRAGGVFGSRTRLIIMSAYCMRLGSCGG